MAIYTGILSAQNTSVYLCDVQKPRGASSWFANVTATGTFGGGTVSYQISYDGGTTKSTIMQDGAATAATSTTAQTLNIRLAGEAHLASQPKLYASIATATTPSLAITVQDGR